MERGFYSKGKRPLKFILYPGAKVDAKDMHHTMQIAENGYEVILDMPLNFANASS